MELARERKNYTIHCPAWVLQVTWKEGTEREEEREKGRERGKEREEEEREGERADGTFASYSPSSGSGELTDAPLVIIR